MSKRRIPQQLIPLFILLVVIVAVFITARAIMIPDGFGKYGYYRAGAVDDVASLSTTFAGYKACLECHDDIYQIKQAAHHRQLSCEVCHGPSQLHVEAPDEVTPTAPRDRGYCPLCHGYNVSRPSGFPQILPEIHNPGKPCMSCHNPHAPTIPRPPEDCSACHREISSRKMVSHHATVLCTNCHIAPPDHWKDPLSIRVWKPTNREVCGKCHARDAASDVGIPRIDLDNHGQPYLCWECHYPHSPEAK